jgi:hypothetical protein
MVKIVRMYYEPLKNLLSEKYCKINGMEQGEYKTYYENGKIDEIINYINRSNVCINNIGKYKYSEYKSYYANGRLESISYYNGINMLEMKYKGYYENGKLKALANYIDNQLNGEYIHYNEAGEIELSICNFINVIKQTF